MGSGIEWEIRPERPEDRPAVEELVASVFGPGRFAKSAYRLREGVEPEHALSFVAVEGGTLRGSLRFWPISVGGSLALLLGPLAVQPDQRGRGIGIGLMERGIEGARQLSYRAILLVGDPPYYARVGFAPVSRGQIVFPGPVDPGRIMGRSLVEGGVEALAGKVRGGRIDHAVSGNSVGIGGLTIS